MHNPFRGLAEVVTEKANGGLVSDIGCNDGLMLMAANGMGARTLGIDPAANIVEIANERGVDVHVAYFNPATAAEVLETHDAPKVICSTNTFHTSDERRVGKACVCKSSPRGYP